MAPCRRLARSGVAPTSCRARFILRRSARLLTIAAGLAVGALLVARLVPRRPCVDRVHVVTSAPDTVDLAWRARCPVTGLQVWRDTALVWHLDGRLSSPVRYGQVPPGAVVGQGPREPLRRGFTYFLFLVYDDPDARTGTGIDHTFHVPAPGHPAPAP